MTAYPPGMMRYKMPSNRMPWGKRAAMISPTSLPKAAPGGGRARCQGSSSCVCVCGSVCVCVTFYSATSFSIHHIYHLVDFFEVFDKEPSLHIINILQIKK